MVCVCKLIAKKSEKTNGEEQDGTKDSGTFFFCREVVFLIFESGF